MPILETERLILRNWRAADRQPFAQMNADPLVMEFMPATLSNSESDLLEDKIEKHIQTHGFGLFAAERRASLSFIGFIGLSIPSFQARFTPCVEVGWRLSAIGMTHDPAEDFDHPKLPDGHPLRRHVLYRLKASVHGSL
jgi:RimJ/RimL family protein N-acetyltransferase